MAHGNPLLAKDIFDQIDAEWFDRWLVWTGERRKAKVPDSVVGMFAKD
jgi:hypothetical protein